MLSMLSKYVELNGTIDDVMKGSMTESYGGVWLNSTQRPSGLCEIEETYDEEVTITDRVPYQVEVEVWCWSIRCTEWETHYREEKRKQNVTKTRSVIQCDVERFSPRMFSLVELPAASSYKSKHW